MITLKRIIFPIAILLLSLLITAALAVGVVAEDKDISRPGTTSKVKIESVDILEKLGVEITEAEKNYLTVYGESSISYGSHIPTSNIKLDYDKDAARLSVNAGVYEYISESGANVTWIPTKVFFGENSLDLSPFDDGRYYATIDSFSETEDAMLRVIYKTSIDLSVNFINSLINKTYSDAVAWDKYKNYLESVDAYEADKIIYQNYLVSKRVYDEKLSAYKVYLDELDKYNAAKAEYDAYVAAMKAYNAEYEKYLKYLEEKKEYEYKLDLYNKYVENIEIVKKQLAIIEGTKLFSTSHNRSVYSAIHGNLVNLVMENKDLMANEFVGASERAIDNAGEATVALKTMYAEYYSQPDEQGKYTYYAINYQNFKDNFIKLFNSLDKLYGNAKVKIAIEEQGYKVKFEIFLAQLYYTVIAISDDPVQNFDGNAYYDSSYIINRKSPLTILEGKEYIVDTGAAQPLKSGYPTPCEMPTLTVYPEPQKPTQKIEPIAPDVVDNPGTAPAIVQKPVAPSFVSAPLGFSSGEKLPPEAEMIVSEYRTGALSKKPLREVSEKFTFEISVNKKVFNAKEIVVSFCDESGKSLYSTAVEQGSYAEFIGTVPTKDETVSAFYVFEGWADSEGNPVDITLIKSDTDITLYPFFKEYIKTYDVVWEVDSEIVITSCAYGEIPSLGYTPTRPDSAKYYYKFSGWNKEVTPVTGNSQQDRYFARFEKEYIVPVFNGKNLIGGAEVVKNGEVWKVDCSAESVGESYTRLRIDLSYLLTRVAEFSSFSVSTLGYEAQFSYSDAVRMNESGVRFFELSTSTSTTRFTFVPTLLGHSGERIDSPASVALDFRGFTFSDAEIARIYRVVNGSHSYVRGNITSSSLSLTVPCGGTYYVAAEYEAHILPTGPISLNIVGNTNLSYGESFDIEYTVPKGVRLISVYMIDRYGMRSEITDDSIKMPIGGCSIGVDYEYIEYTVNFISSGRIIGTRVYKYGEIPEMPANPIKTADRAFTYTFDKWINLLTGTDEISPVTSNVNYEALYTKKAVPVKEPVDGLLISAPILKKLSAAAFFGGFVLLVVIPCAMIMTFKIIVRKQRKAPRKRPKGKR